MHIIYSGDWTAAIYFIYIEESPSTNEKSAS